MELKNIVSFLLIVYFIILIIVIAKKMKNQTRNENLVFRKLNKPDYRVENSTQFFYINLLKNLRLNQNKKLLKLKSPCLKNKYIHDTTPNIIKENLAQVMEIIVNALNKGNKYTFVKTNYGNIIELKDRRGIYNYIFEVFLQDVKNIIMMKLKVNILVFPDKNIKKFFNDQETCTQITTSAFPIYNIGIPSKDQYIPLPTQVIPTANDVLSDKGIKYPQPIQPKYVYINRLKIQNSTLVVNPNEKCLSDAVNGKEGKCPEFTWVTGSNNPYIEKYPKRNEWPTLNDQPKDQGQWPCTPIKQKWNTNGVYVPKPEPSKLCPGVTWATKDLALQAQYWPTLATVPRNSGQNAWLFELSRGIPDFPTGRSV